VKNILITIVKYGVSLALLGWLFLKFASDASFSELTQQSKNWPFLALGLVAALAALSSTIVRWYLLVRTLGIPFRLRDAFRLGFLGYLMNFFTLGVVGGDLLKAVFLAREHPHKQAEAAAAVAIDRIIGLYALLVVAATGMLWLVPQAAAGMTAGQANAMRTLQIAVVSLAAGGAAAGAFAMIPGVLTSPLWSHAGRIPKVGNFITQLLKSLEIYRRKQKVLGVALLMSAAAHLISAASVYFTAKGLFHNAPSMIEHFAIVPLSMVAHALPLPGGLGAFEYALTYLYTNLFPQVNQQQGFITALAYRLITLILAGVGMVFYLASRRQLNAMIHEAMNQEAMNKTAPQQTASETAAESAKAA